MFRKGIFQHWQELLQGQTSGILLGATDGNPNSFWQSRLTGLHSFQTNPLILLDGVPIESGDFFSQSALYAIDAQMIESIEIQRDASNLALWGQRAYGGIIAIKTKTHHPKTASQTLHFSSTAGISQIIGKVPILSAAAYRAEPNAQNFGNSNDWQSLVLQQPIDLQNNLHYSNATIKNTVIYGSLQYRQGGGVVRNTSYSQYGGNIGITYTTLHNRLKLEAYTTAQRRTSAVGFSEAFRYALTFNPTAPIFDATGKHYELNAFDIFNPLSILESVKDRNITAFNTTIKASYLINNWLKISSFYNIQNQNIFEGEVYRKNALFRGENTNGRAVQTNIKNAVSYANIMLEVDKKWANWQLNMSLGGDWREGSFNSNSLIYTNFPNNAFDYKNINAGTFASNIKEDKTNKVNAIFTNIKIKYLPKNIFTNISFRNQDSKTHLGIYAGFNPLKNITVQGGYSDVSSFKINEIYTFDNRYLYYGERKKTTHLEVVSSWLSGRLQGRVNWENGKATISIYENNIQKDFLTIQNQLFTIDVLAKWIEKTNFSWSSKIMFSSLKNTILAVANTNNRRYQSIGAPGNGNLFYHEWQEGQPIGGFWANEMELVNGIYRIKDLNNNNNTEDDTRFRGQSIPSSWVSWVNSMRFKKLELSWILRGVFGQTKVNEYRVFYENATFNSIINPYRSRLYVPNSPYPYNALNVENADFIRLDNLTLTYNFIWGKWKSKIFVGAQNLWTLSKYTGLDPEIRLSDIGRKCDCPKYF